MWKSLFGRRRGTEDSPFAVFLAPNAAAINQAVSGIGCRPTRLWVLNRLRMLFGHAYIPRSQPDHVDFPTDWKQPPIQLMYRSIFVGSRDALGLPTLGDTVPMLQEMHRAT